MKARTKLNFYCRHELNQQSLTFVKMMETLSGYV